jgi:hypothetical protein
VDAYIPSSEDDGTTVKQIQRAAAFDSALPLVMLGGFNIDLRRMLGANERQQETAILLTTWDLRTGTSLKP